MASHLHEAVEDRLAASDQRYTPLRRVLVDVLSASGRPLTVPEILDMAPDLPQSSAYRNLTILIDAGVARRVATTKDHWRVELAEDIAGHHHHLVCAGCGRVEDVEAPADLERALRDTARAIAAGWSFEVREHRLDLLGICVDCQSS